jgi:HD-GYP domain-containing protein (c-di-GMP phosphodiesterase class II)
MSAAAPPAAAPATLHSEVFLQAVAQLGARQSLKTSQAIYNTQGVMLLGGGARVDQGLYERLVSHRLSTPLDECVEAEASVNAAVLREAAEQAMQRWAFFAQMGQPPRMRSMLLEAVSSIPLPKPVALHLTVARHTRAALFDHGVLMGLLCAHLVREGGGMQHDIGMAATAGVLHDIGMLHIDPSLLDSNDALSGDELKPLYVHPITASLIMGRFADYEKELLRAVIEHHERLDGSGYPRALTGEQMSPLGRLLSLAEVVTAMFDGGRRFPEQRVSLLLRMNPRRYDPSLVPSIHRLLRAVPLPPEVSGAAADESIETLRRLDGLLTDWHAAVGAMWPRLSTVEKKMLQPVSEQAETLRRMLYEAGVTPEQLALVEGVAASDVALCIELWALAQELQWQLRATANHLQRRWRAGESKLDYPPLLAMWLEQVKALGGPSRA